VPSSRIKAPDDGNQTEPDKGTSLNFKVSPEFKKEFKGFAVAQGISMTDLLKEGFVLFQKKATEMILHLPLSRVTARCALASQIGRGDDA
jgi:hypothetical protein